MAKVIVLGLAKSGTTGLWSVLVKSYPRRYLQFFEGQYLPSRYNKYFGQTNSEQNPRDVVSKQIIGPDFNFTDLASFDKIIWMVRDPRDRLISYLLYRHYDYRYDSDEFVREQLDLLRLKERDPDALAMIDLEARLLLPRPTLESAFFWNDHQKNNFLSTLIEEGRAFIFKYEDFVNQEYSGLENFWASKCHEMPRCQSSFNVSFAAKLTAFGITGSPKRMLITTWGFSSLFWSNTVTKTSGRLPKKRKSIRNTAHVMSGQLLTSAANLMVYILSNSEPVSLMCAQI